jgi:hypothetical protein
VLKGLRLPADSTRPASLESNRCFEKGRRRFEIHARRRISRKLGHSNPQHQIKSNVCAKLRRNGPTTLGGDSWGRHFLPVRRHDPRERCNRLSAALQVPKNGSDGADNTAFFPRSVGGLNRSPQHFILEGKDGVWDGTEIS